MSLEHSGSNGPLLGIAHSQSSGHDNWYTRARRKAHQLVEGTIDTYFEYTLLAVIFLNVVLLLASTIVVDPDPRCLGEKCERLGDRYNTFFEVCEWTSVAIFTVEYLLRMWACVEIPAVAKAGPVFGRIKYALTFFPLVDLLSIAPNLLSLLPVIGETPDFTTAGRIVRLVRVFKADQYINAFALLGKVLYDNRLLLIATSFYSAICWVVSSALLFYTEQNNPALGHHFQSIPQAMFPTLLMLTGEYPLADFTAVGQVIAGFIALVAVAIFAVPTGVLGSGFIQAVQETTGSSLEIDG